jgi:regulatory protein
MPTQENQEERARTYLLKLFKHRPRSRYEILSRLRQKGFSPSVIETTLQKAESSGLMNDARFAKLWIEDRVARKPRSRRALQRELQAKRVDSEHIEKALARVELDEEALAKQLIDERLTRLRSVDHETRRRRLVGFLRRRGFSDGLIRKALKEALDDS